MVEKHGEQRGFCGNHRTYLDPPLIVVTAGRDMRFMAKEELRKNPLFAFLGFLPLNKKNRTQNTAEIKIKLKDKNENRKHKIRIICIYNRWNLFPFG